MPSEGGRGSKVASSHYFQPRSDDDLRSQTSFGLRANDAPTCTGNIIPHSFLSIYNINSWLLMSLLYATELASIWVLIDDLTLMFGGMGSRTIDHVISYDLQMERLEKVAIEHCWSTTQSGNQKHCWPHIV
jgi:hypothetical protein